MDMKEKKLLYRGAFLELRRSFVILAALIIAGSWLSLSVIGDMDERNENFANVELVTLDGKTQVDSSVFAQSPLTVVNIWATYCGPCIREMPEFAEVSHEYAERGVQFVGICGDVTYDESGEPNASLLADAYEVIDITGADYQQYLPTEACFDMVRSLASNGFPYTYILNDEGTVCKLFVGGVSKDDLIKARDWQLRQ